MSDGHYQIIISSDPIDRGTLDSWIRDPSCGAIASFEGIIRNQNDEKPVNGLEYSVYEDFFYAETERILQEAELKWPIKKACLIQRTGKLLIGECGVIIAVSSPHRRESIEALSYILEEFKKRAPVWKKEFYQDHSDWVLCHHSNQQDFITS
jgi:molybdopterin synthase catalytic subunit